MWRTDSLPVEGDEDSAPESISDTEDLINWNGDIDNPNDCDGDCTVDFEADVDQDISIKDPESPEQQGVSPVPNISGLIPPMWESKRHAEQVFVTVNAMKTRTNKGVMKK
jgi:hypothetical protein